MPPITESIEAVRVGVVMLEFAARFTRAMPIMSRVQVDFVRQGWEPRTDKDRRELGWKPMALDIGLKRYVESRAAGRAG